LDLAKRPFGEGLEREKKGLSVNGREAIMGIFGVRNRLGKGGGMKRLERRKESEKRESQNKSLGGSGPDSSKAK